MLRVDGSYLYMLGARLHPLVEATTTAPIRAEDALYPLYLAETALTHLLQHRFYGLRLCVNQGESFIAVIREVAAKISNMPTRDAPLEAFDVYRIKQQAQIFENVLTAELQNADLYYVTPKGSHATINLIADGRTAFPDDLTTKVPDAVLDTQEATRCLAFERFTACGFHLHRANEAVLRKYWDVVTKGAAKPKQESMGAYLGELKRRKKGKGSGKVRAVLTEIKNLHRNPIIHPEHTLDQKQAMALMGVIHASITYMLEEIPSPIAPPLAVAGAGGS